MTLHLSKNNRHAQSITSFLGRCWAAATSYPTCTRCRWPRLAQCHGAPSHPATPCTDTTSTPPPTIIWPPPALPRPPAHTSTPPPPSSHWERHLSEKNRTNVLLLPARSLIWFLGDIMAFCRYFAIKYHRLYKWKKYRNTVTCCTVGWVDFE